MRLVHAVIDCAHATGEIIIGIIIGLVGAHVLVAGVRYIWRKRLRDWLLRP